MGKIDTNTKKEKKTERQSNQKTAENYLITYPAFQDSILVERPRV